HRARDLLVISVGEIAEGRDALEQIGRGAGHFGRFYVRRTGVAQERGTGATEPVPASLCSLFGAHRDAAVVPSEPRRVGAVCHVEGGGSNGIGWRLSREFSSLHTG